MHVGATLARFLAPVTTFVVVLPIAACTGDQNLQLPIIEDGTEVVTVELAAAQNPRVLQIDVDVGGITGFGHVADVTGTGDGGFGVLDRMEKAISVYGPSGRLERRIGKSGEGPGEFSDPIAVVWTGLYWVVWDRDPNKTFTIFDTAGTVTSTIRRPVDGDWRANIFRAGPALREYPYHTTSEDLTHRLLAAG